MRGATARMRCGSTRPAFGARRRTRLAATGLTPLVLLGITPQVLAHHPKHKFATVQRLVDYAKKNPGKLTFASSGVGSAQHIAGEDFKMRAGVDMLHVPFKGTGEALAALLSGDVDMTFSSTGSAMPQVKGGRLVLLEYRKEDPTIPIRPEHKMSVGEAKMEVEAEGFTLAKVDEALPRQHILIFTVKDP